MSPWCLLYWVMCVDLWKQADVYVQSPYFVCQAWCVTSHCYTGMHVSSRLSGLSYDNNEPTLSGNQQLSNKIIILYLCMWIDMLHRSYTNTVITLFSVLTWCQTFKIPAVLYVCYTRSYEIDSDSVKLFFQLFSQMPFTLLKEKPNFTNRLYSGPEISSTLYMWLSLNATIVWNCLCKYIFII